RGRADEIISALNINHSFCKLREVNAARGRGQNDTIVAHHRSSVGIGEEDATKSLAGYVVLARPGSAAVGRAQNHRGKFTPHGRTRVGVRERDAIEINPVELRRPGGAPIGRAQDGSTDTYYSPRVRIDEGNTRKIRRRSARRLGPGRTSVRR